MEEIGTEWQGSTGPSATGWARLRMLLWALAIGLLVGFAGLGEPLDGFMRSTRNAVARHPASGRIVVVAIDDKSVQQLALWPLPRSIYADAADRLDRLGAREIVFDIDFSSRSEAAEDAALEKVFARLGHKVTIPVQIVSDPVTGIRTDVLPLARFSSHVDLADINVWYNFAGEVWKIPYSFKVAGHAYPTLAAKMGRRAADGAEFHVDYAIDPNSIPRVSLVDLLRGKIPSAAVAGKTAVIGVTSRQLGDTYVVPGHGIMPGVFLHVLGAETLREGIPVDLGWAPPFLLAFLLCAGALFARRYRISLACLLFGVAAFLAVPLWLEQRLLFIEIMPSLTLILIVAGRLSWTVFRSSYRMRGITNAESGLANLAALRQEVIDRSRRMVAARVRNYAEVAATLTLEDERLLIEQIARRLTLGAPRMKLYQGDEGIFAWFADEGSIAELGEHLDGLFELFRSPVRVRDRQLDLTMTFGVDGDPSRSLPNRLGSALVAADEAFRDGWRWKEYDAARLQDAEWRLSLLSQLDEAIEAGDLWIAYQPKLDLASGRIIGAEALARWTHPEKGPISPADFVLAAEQGGRIKRLTTSVLERAVQAAAELHAIRPHFNVAVNLSARLIDDLTLTETIGDLLARHLLPAECLTLEITETAALSGSASSLDTLHRLRAMGVQLSIDDYGTGLSTLSYLKRIPANEIKIDKSFIQGIATSSSDKLMVHSTIQLAHSLGRKVVAEGVEQRKILDLLRAMDCDVVQGFLVGVPMPFEELVRLVPIVEPRRARRA
ncbi:MAG TPA: EAL domain-containing protein [Allosphingosinicella sp.]|jgi:EAL domain-containing protein (putative c-di-GMP-specific phosphodiesterase class I)/CHASE2 domain-containing sensor protein